MDTKKIKELIALARERGIGELEFGEGSMKVSFKLKPSSSEGRREPEAKPETPGKEGEGQSPGENWIRSPMVGVFRPQDGSASEGTAVAAGDVIGHVESMGILNEVTSDVAGVVTKIEIGDGDPVEYGQPLVLVKTQAKPSSQD